MDDEKSHRLILRLLNEDLVSIQAFSRHSINSDTFMAATLARQELRTAHQQIDDLRIARIVSREEVSQREAVRANEISARLLFRQLNPDEPLPNPLADHQIAIAEASDQSPTAIKAESNASPCPQPTSSALRSQPTTLFGYPRPILKRSADDLIDAEVPPSKKHESDQIGSQYQPIYFGRYQRSSFEHDRLSGVFGEMPVAPSPMSEQFKELKRPAEEETPTSRPTKKQDSRHDVFQPRQFDCGDAAAPSSLEISNTSEIDAMAEASHGFSFTSVRLAPFEYPTVSETQSSTPPAPFCLDAPLPSASPPRSLVLLPLELECIACGDMHLRTQCYENECKHAYCTKCINRLVTNALRNTTHFQPQCCKLKMDISKLQHLLREALTPLVKARQLEMSVPIQDRLYCAECSAFILKPLLGSKTVGCKKCPCITCTICKEKVNEGKTHQEGCQNKLEQSVKELEALAGKNGWRKCSRCQIFVEHRTGCNHMT
ncbi:hypothetical protein M438DRAFT_389159 [Aureobasidium pullulans EXF-150]|uniref:RING-type domain-containing protein n=1 Tax=Aureobasidium pullulans EXF-150 TaxID=1043002 RepID=A0A074XUI9_AURPU|nr:uncharacterized protein M438DRAFT_389159 [Aureobasidium pullulans EXF-150]KEQ87299.1 hypothetical protein M438DRAFT_389159 [Aureobasidium pullulans EXF-150]